MALASVLVCIAGLAGCGKTDNGHLARTHSPLDPRPGRLAIAEPRWDPPTPENGFHPVPVLELARSHPSGH